MTRSTPIRIATRKSPLALWQAEYVKNKLQSENPGLNVELVTMVTKGDIILDTPLAKVGGKGLFVKELELAMLENRADLAVHSMKDVPAEFPKGLDLITICERENPTDAFISNTYKNVDELPQHAIVGTCSLRRQCQLKARRPDLIITDLRGNVGTRLNKLDNGEFDAIILASAGLQRLGLEHRITSSMSPQESLPAVGQGAIGIECRTDDTQLITLLTSLNHQDTSDRVRCERAMNNKLEGGCQIPIGSYAELNGDELWLRALVGQPDGKRIIRDEIRGHRQEAENLGRRLAEKLLAQGAKEILTQLDA